MFPVEFDLLCDQDCIDKCACDMSTLWKLDTNVGGLYNGYRIDSAYLSEQFWDSVQLDFGDGANNDESLCCNDNHDDFKDGMHALDMIWDNANKDIEGVERNERAHGRDNLSYLPKLITTQQFFPSSRFQPDTPSAAKSLPDLIVSSPMDRSAQYDTPTRPKAPTESNCLKQPPRSFSPETPLTQASTFLDTLVTLTRSPMEGSPGAPGLSKHNNDLTIVDFEIFVNVIEDYRRAQSKAPLHQDKSSQVVDVPTGPLPDIPGMVFDLQSAYLIDSAVDCEDGAGLPSTFALERQWIDNQPPL